MEGARKTLNSFVFYGLVVFQRTKEYVEDLTISVANYYRSCEGDLWIWDDGHSSFVSPVTNEDKKGCWYYDPRKQILTSMETTMSSNKRWGWIGGTVYQGENTIDFTDCLTRLKLRGNSTPSISLVRCLLTQKLGIYIGKTAIFHVIPRFDVINEKTFTGSLITDDEKKEYSESWSD
jgi:hypothetical protein